MSSIRTLSRFISVATLLCSVTLQRSFEEPMRFPAMTRAKLILCFAACGFSAAYAQPPIPAQRQLVLAQVEQSRTKYKTLADWQKRREELRLGFLRGAGLWPMPERTPLKPIIHSKREY